MTCLNALSLNSVHYNECEIPPKSLEQYLLLTYHSIPLPSIHGRNVVFIFCLHLLCAAKFKFSEISEILLRYEFLFECGAGAMYGNVTGNVTKWCQF